VRSASGGLKRGGSYWRGEAAPAPTRVGLTNRPPKPTTKRQSSSPNKLPRSSNRSTRQLEEARTASEKRQGRVYKGQFSRNLVTDGSRHNLSFSPSPVKPAKFNESLHSYSIGDMDMDISIEDSMVEDVKGRIHDSSTSSIRKRLRRQNLSKNYRLSKTKLSTKLGTFLM
jgi:hypothetical protein